VEGGDLKNRDPRKGNKTHNEFVPPDFSRFFSKWRSEILYTTEFSVLGTGRIKKSIFFSKTA